MIAAKAVAFKVAAGAEFADRQRRTLEGANLLASRLSQSDVAEAVYLAATDGSAQLRFPAGPDAIALANGTHP